MDICFSFDYVTYTHNSFKKYVKYNSCCKKNIFRSLKSLTSCSAQQKWFGLCNMPIVKYHGTVSPCWSSPWKGVNWQSYDRTKCFWGVYFLAVTARSWSFTASKKWYKQWISQLLKQQYKSNCKGTNCIIWGLLWHCCFLMAKIYLFPASISERLRGKYRKPKVCFGWEVFSLWIIE